MGAPATSIPIPVANVAGGVRFDAAPHLLPENASPIARNVIFSKGHVASMRGWSADAFPTKPFSTPVLHLAQFYPGVFFPGDPILAFRQATAHFFYPDAGPAAWTAITPAASDGRYFMSTDAIPVTAQTFENNLVFTAGYKPWYWAPEDTATKLVPLPGIDDINLTRAYICGSFANRTLLAGVEMDGTLIPNRYVWSDLSRLIWTTGFISEEDGSSDAGFADLPADSDDEVPYILSMQQLRDYLIIYCSNSIWVLQHVGGLLTFVRRQVRQKLGIQVINSVVNFGDKHLFWGSDGGFYLFNGVETKPIGEEIWSWVRNNLHPSTSRIIAWRRRSPDLACFAFPTIGNDALWPDTGIAFNIEEGSWTIFDAPFTAAGSFTEAGLSDVESDSVKIDDLPGLINSLSGPIDSLSKTYTESKALFFTDRLEVLANRTGDVYSRGGWTKDGADMTSEWRSKVFDAGDPLIWKEITGVRVGLRKQGDVFRGEAPPAGEYDITMSIYAADNPMEDWENLTPFATYEITLGTTSTSSVQVDTQVPARYFQVGFSATSTAATEKAWVLSDFVPYVQPIGLA